MILTTLLMMLFNKEISANPKFDWIKAKGKENYMFDTCKVESFSVDDPHWKTSTFKLGDLELENTFGFVDSKKNLPLNHKGYDEVMRVCGEDLRTHANNERSFSMPLTNYSKYGTVNYYPTTERFRNYDGIDLIPENKDSYVRGSPYAKKLHFHERKSVMGEDVITIQRCKATREDGKEGGWVVDRVGPFYAKGGYDWWQIGWTDVGGFSDILESYPKGFDVNIKAMMPVSEDGERLGHPPIHIHHIHLVPNMGVRPRNRMVNTCMAGQKNCYNSSLFMEQHGDYQCQTKDDGIECLTTNDMRRFSQPLDLEGELNDVRPRDSETIKFYYQAAFQWSPIDFNERPVSQTTIMAPGNLDPFDQLSRVLTFPTPTHSEHMIWYTGRAWADGELLRNKLHAHNMVFDSSEFFVAEPRDLGLDKMMPKRSYETLQTTNQGFANNDAFRQWILDNLEEAQRSYDQNCLQREHPGHEACGRPRPRLICAAKYDSESFNWGGNLYKIDRRPKTWCEPWKFREGDSFVVTGFSRHLQEAVKPDQPGYIPAYIPGHVSWHMWWYHSTWTHSYINRIVCNQEGIFFDSAGEFGITFMMSALTGVIIDGGVPRTKFYFRIWSVLLPTISISLFFVIGRFLRKRVSEIRYKKLT